MKINVVLYHPEIPQNTGNIMRSCVGFHAKLHLIKPLGFRLDETRLKRSCVDYYEYIDYEVYEDFTDFKNKNKGKYYYFTRYGKKSPSSIRFEKDEEPIYLIFGSESIGIAYDILKQDLEHCYRIPTTDKIRSLNLSNCVAIALFLASEQLNSEEIAIPYEPETLKGKDFLEKVDLSVLSKKYSEYKGDE